MRPILCSFILCFLFFSCTKEVEIQIPDSNPQLVVEGHIEPGQPPIVFLSKSVAYFDPVDLNAFQNNFVTDATVIVSAGGMADTLDLICTDNIPANLRPLVASQLGIDPAVLAELNICGYTTFNPLFFGQEGQTYQLRIIRGAEEFESITNIPRHLDLDSTWFSLYGDEEERGFINARMTEPKGFGNAYRWFAKREGKDAGFIAPIGSAFEDKFIDGQSFEFFAARGSVPNSTAEDDLNEDRGFFKIGDTVIVKFCTTDAASFQFYRAFETEVGNMGNPFASPTQIRGNISNGAFGIWGGYGISFDTVICR
jgi:hypothetical protein